MLTVHICHPSTNPILTAVVMLVIAACAEAAVAHPTADAGQSFRPVSALFFLPERAPLVVRDAALVPDSKITWDLRVTAKSLGLDDVQVEVRRQAAYLRGTVPSDASRQTMVEVARRTHGVKSVTETLEVKP